MRVVNCVPMVRNGSVNVMGRDIGKALRGLHAEVRDLPYRPGENAPAEIIALLNWLADGPEGGLLVDINGAVMTSTPVLRAVERAGPALSCFTLMTDNPTYYPSRLARWPEGATIGVTEQSFVESARLMNFDRPRFVFCAHAGDVAAEHPLPASARDIDYLFIGNVARVPDLADYARTSFPDAPGRVSLFLDAHELISDRVTPFEAVVTAARQGGRPQRLKDVALVANALEHYLNNAARARALRRLAHLPVTVVGSVDEAVVEAGGAIRPLGFRPFADCLALMGRAKVLLNVRPGFVNGGHERIFYGLSRGAAVLCDASRYLEPDRTAHGYVGFFQHGHDNLVEALIALRMFREAQGPESMIRDYNRRHTWHSRLSNIDVIKGSGISRKGS